MADQDQTTRDDANDGGQQSGDSGGFTQADVDRIIDSRLDRAKNTAVKSLLEGLGLESVDELQSTITEARERREAEMSELEKARQRAEELEQRYQQAEARARQTALVAEFKTIASQLGASYPQNAIKLVDNAESFLDDDGNVMGVESAVKDLIETGQLPTRTRQAPGLDGGAGGGERPSDKEKPIELTESERRVAQRLGIPPEEYAKRKES